MCLNPRGNYLRRLGSTIVPTGDQEVWEMWGRLDGEQNNSYAEAMALLQTLRFVHPDTPLEVYIDNYGVIQQWHGLELNCSRDRAKRGARAIWNRIHALKGERDRRGTDTVVRWVHSHVDDEDRRTRKKAPKVHKANDWWKPKPDPTPVGTGRSTSPMECACGGDASGHCIQAHPHHIGNDLADALAERGKALDCAHSKIQKTTARGSK